MNWNFASWHRSIPLGKLLIISVPDWVSGWMVSGLWKVSLVLLGLIWELQCYSTGWMVEIQFLWTHCCCNDLHWPGSGLSCLILWGTFPCRLFCAVWHCPVNPWALCPGSKQRVQIKANKLKCYLIEDYAALQSFSCNLYSHLHIHPVSFLVMLIFLLAPL